MRVRLRQEVATYDGVRDNFTWPDHVLRVMVTAGMVSWLRPRTIIDPACGDASVVEYAHRLRPIEKAYLSDLSKPQIAELWGRDFGFEMSLATGDAEFQMRRSPHADLVILTEILEHVESPDALLRVARGVADHLVASSPLGEPVQSGNHEHVWSWSKADFREMLEAAGWTPIAYTEIDPKSMYTFQLWACR